MDPNILTSPVLLSWHGFLTFVAVSVAVVLVAHWGRRLNIDVDVVYDVAVWVIIGGIVGARAVHVIDLWVVDEPWGGYSQNLGLILQVWRGGIALFGAVLFGFLGGAVYVWGGQLLARMNEGEKVPLWKIVGVFLPHLLLSAGLGLLFGGVYRLLAWLKNHKTNPYMALKDTSVGRLADITAPALILAQMIGRVGDIINGEHFAKATDLAWGFIYTHPTTIALYNSARRDDINALLPSHPVAVYEILWDAAVLGTVWMLRGRLAPSGMLFALYLMLYSLGRFFIQFIRLDRVWFAGLQEAHVIALIVMAITVSLLAARARWLPPVAAPARTPRRRRRTRA
jgi:phosphatidylglycerol:prolipoprotein diacylglycerol transferase